MENVPVLRSAKRGAIAATGSRQLAKALGAVDAQTQLAIAEVESAAEEAAAVVQARNAVAAAAAQADAMLGGLLNALPLYDAMDADFRSQLKQATRARVIADIWQFNP